MPNYHAPIGIMSFDRPDYFDKVLQSLVSQIPAGVGSRPIYLFQDGARNSFSGNIYASQDLIDTNVQLFQKYVPHGTVLESPHNLGVALNYDRAERLFFEELGCEAAIFLEDDLILSPFYIDVLDHLVDLALNDTRIGYVSAVGNHMLSVDEQGERKHELTILQQTWGFALTRRQWNANQPYLEEYFKFVRDIDYRKRSHLDIFDLYTSWGASRIFSSQDRAKYIASTLNSNLWLTTIPSFGKYIGAIGLHCNEEMYAAGRFSETNLFPEPLENFAEISEARYRELLDRQLRDIRAVAPAIQLNQELSFGIGHNGFLALGKGFHLPEKWGVWAATEEPHITVQPPENARDGRHTLLVKSRYNMPPGQSEIAVAVLIDGKEAGWLRWNGNQQVLAVPIPRFAGPPGDPMEIEFRAPLVARPSDFNSGGDVRPLGLGLRSLSIVASQVPEPARGATLTFGEPRVNLEVRPQHRQRAQNEIAAHQIDFNSGPSVAAEKSPLSDLLPRMTPAETRMFQDLLGTAGYYLEYGSGGSTLAAVKSRVKHIVSMETDRAWLDRLKENQEIGAAIKASRLTFRHIDVGPVGEWGIPRGETKLRSWPQYASDPFLSTELNFDIILVDGRFRMHCLLAIVNCATPDTRVLLHDYHYRHAYTLADKYFDTLERVESSILLKIRRDINRRALYLDLINSLFDI